MVKPHVEVFYNFCWDPGRNVSQKCQEIALRNTPVNDGVSAGCGRAEPALQNLYQSFWVQLGGCATPSRPGLKLSQHTVPPPGGLCPPLRPWNLFIICTRALYGRELTLSTLPSSLWVPGLCDARPGRFIMMYWK